MDKVEMGARYRDLVRAVDAEFKRNQRLHGSRIKCRAGCSECCHQLFQITEIEAAAISAGVREMPTAERRELAAKAEAYSIARSALVAANGEPEAWGSLPPPGTRLACPALDEQGACLIYERRPLICRKFGIPLYNPRRPGRVFACELNFREGEPVEDPDLVRIQTGIHEQSRALQDAYNASGRRRDPRPITVARAILEDFTDCG